MSAVGLGSDGGAGSVVVEEHVAGTGGAGRGDDVAGLLAVEAALRASHAGGS